MSSLTIPKSQMDRLRAECLTDWVGTFEGFLLARYNIFYFTRPDGIWSSHVTCIFGCEADMVQFKLMIS
jgi:hypothetical protein